MTDWADTLAKTPLMSIWKDLQNVQTVSKNFLQIFFETLDIAFFLIVLMCEWAEAIKNFQEAHL